MGIDFSKMKTDVSISCTYIDDMVDIIANLNGKNKGIYYQSDSLTFFEELIDLLNILSIDSFLLTVRDAKNTYSYNTSKTFLMKAINLNKGINKSSVTNLENLMKTKI